jgi:hypothetical protein
MDHFKLLIILAYLSASPFLTNKHCLKHDDMTWHDKETMAANLVSSGVTPTKLATKPPHPINNFSYCMEI